MKQQGNEVVMKKHKGWNNTMAWCRHQDIVDSLVKTLQKEYQILENNIEYRDRTGRVVGEIDILGYKNGEFHLYEVKTGKDKNATAKDQLLRAKELLGLDKVRLFYVHVPKPCGLQEYIVKEIG